MDRQGGLERWACAGWADGPLSKLMWCQTSAIVGAGWPAVSLLMSGLVGAGEAEASVDILLGMTNHPGVSGTQDFQHSYWKSSPLLVMAWSLREDTVTSISGFGGFLPVYEPLSHTILARPACEHFIHYTSSAQA